MDLLHNIWFIIIGILLIGYSILDGFDLGIGILFPFLAKEEKEKRILFKSIGPFWDGNEVWLITAGAVLFASFPQVYATVFSGFYLAFMLLLFSLIFRAISIEFWHNDKKRTKFWEWAFILGSFVPSLLYGVALGNVVFGIPLNDQMEFTGSFFTLLRPYPLLIGFLGLTSIILQGSTFVILKTTGSLQVKAKKITKIILNYFIILFIITIVVTLISMYESFLNWYTIVAVFVVIISVTMNRIYLVKDKDNIPFFMSSLSFLGLWSICGALHFPNLVKASNEHDLSLTIYNSSSSELTLKIMLIIVLIGMPIVIAYTSYIYWIFRGKEEFQTKP